MKITPVNGVDRDWTKHRYIMAFGAYGETVLMVWANHLEDALDEAIDWIADNAPGLLADDAVTEEYRRLVDDEHVSDAEAIEAAELDTTRGGNAGNYLNSWEWGVLAEDPTRRDILNMQGRA